MYCFDTSVCIDVFNGIERIRHNLVKMQKHTIYLTPITLCELYKGAAHSYVTQKRLSFIQELLQQTEFVELSPEACGIFGVDYLVLKRAGKLVKDMDLMIAAVCKLHNLTLITTDKRDFAKIPGLRLEVW